MKIKIWSKIRYWLPVISWIEAEKDNQISTEDYCLVIAGNLYGIPITILAVIIFIYCGGC